MQVQTTINNLIVGKIYIQHMGTYTVKNLNTGLTAVMELVKPKMITFSLKSRKESQHLVRTHTYITDHLSCHTESIFMLVCSVA